MINKKDSNHSNTSRHGLGTMKHFKGRSYIKYSPVFSKHMKETLPVYFIRVLHPNLQNYKMPKNLSGVFGQVVPPSLFYFQFAGMLSVSLMTILTQSYFRDECPICDTLDYRRHLPLLDAFRQQIIYQIVGKIKSVNYRRRIDRLSSVRWFGKFL